MKGSGSRMIRMKIRMMFLRPERGGGAQGIKQENLWLRYFIKLGYQTLETGFVGWDMREVSRYREK